MRLDVVDHGHGRGAKLLFWLIRVVTRRPVPDAIKFIMYHSGFHGGPMRRLLRVAMHGPSAWSVADRELMAAYVSKANECAFCAGAHSAIAARAYRDKQMVAAVFADLDSAPIPEPLRATLRMLGKLTREHTVDADDMRAVLATGVSRQQVEDALAVCFLFNTASRFADAFDFTVLDEQGFDASAKYMLRWGYR